MLKSRSKGINVFISWLNKCKHRSCSCSISWFHSFDLLFFRIRNVGGEVEVLSLDSKGRICSHIFGSYGYTCEDETN